MQKQLLQSLLSVDSEDFDFEHVERLEHLCDQPSMKVTRAGLAAVIQDKLQNFYEIPELERTDFLNMLVRLSREGRSCAKGLELSTLEANLDLLDAWDLELALTLLGYNLNPSRVELIRPYTAHFSEGVRHAAQRAVKLAPVQRWFRRVG